MPNICHKIGLNKPLSECIDAVKTIEGLQSWWTEKAVGSTEINSTIHFIFGNDGPKIEVQESSASKVVWKVIEGPKEWISTQIIFEFKTEEETVLYFQHRNWKTESPFYYHCSTKWAVFILSLKDYIEKGSGRPFPNDIKIENITMK